MIQYGIQSICMSNTYKPFESDDNEHANSFVQFMQEHINNFMSSEDIYNNLQDWGQNADVNDFSFYSKLIELINNRS